MNPSSVDAASPFRFTPRSAGGADGFVGPAEGDDLVRQSQREIAGLVREVAAAARSDIDADAFARLVAERTLQALAAEGVLLWQWEPTPTRGDSVIRRVVQRRGATTDQTLGPVAITAIAELIDEVVLHQTPAVIPPTPIDQADPSETGGINPSEFPLAVVPVPTTHESSFQYVLAVFLESGGTVATQRGYLRFIAQMADLAAGFFDANHTRSLQRQHDWSRAVDREIAQVGSITRSVDLYDRMVDVIAERFEFDRVVLCRLGARRLRRKRGTVVSASHCDQIDRHGESTRETLDMAAAALNQMVGATSVAGHSDLSPCDPGSQGWLRREFMRSDAASHEVATDISSDDHPAEVKACHELIWISGPQGEAESRLGRGAADDSDHWILIASRWDGTTADQIARGPIDRWITHTRRMASDAARLESVPLLRWLAPSSTPSGHAGRTAMMLAVAMITVGLGMMLPMPSRSSAPAVLVPADVQSVYSPRAAIVDQVHVRHDQVVAVGTPLITLRDPALEDEMVRLIGRQNVLRQRRRSIASGLVGGGDRTRQEQLQNEQRLLDEQILANAAQRESLQRMVDGLTILSRVAGTVDAWQIQQTLHSRPVQRGDLLLRVLPETTDWWVLANVSPVTLGHLTRAIDRDALSAKLEVDGSQHPSVALDWDQIGPATAGRHQVRWRLAHERFPQDAAWRSDASGTLDLECGTVSLGRWLWGDSWDMFHRRYRHWFAMGDRT